MGPWWSGLRRRRNRRKWPNSRLAIASDRVDPGLRCRRDEGSAPDRSTRVPRDSPYEARSTFLMFGLRRTARGTAPEARETGLVLSWGRPGIREPPRAVRPSSRFSTSCWNPKTPCAILHSPRLLVRIAVLINITISWTTISWRERGFPFSSSRSKSEAWLNLDEDSSNPPATGGLGFGLWS